MHIPVLLKESIDGLNLKPGSTVIDCTINGGGHSAEIAHRFKDQVKIIGIDLDDDALKRAEEKIKPFSRNFELHHASFRHIDRVVADASSKTVIKEVNGILFDLGLSSFQFDFSGRGFSFQKDEPLVMTFKKYPNESDITAHQIVNEWSEKVIADIIYAYGEERFARRIAKRIIDAREDGPIESTTDLVDLINSAVPAFYRRGRIHPATKTFQALRITVNDELSSLIEGLAKAFELLTLGGRMAVISFHSLEDRIVKNFFKEKSKENKAILINKKPITPSTEEIALNRRSRSAKLRIIEKI